MKRITLLIMLLFILLFISSSTREFFALNSKEKGPDEDEVVIASDASPSIRMLADLYKKGLSRERLGAYQNALLEYNSCNSKAIEMLGSKGLNRVEVDHILPYAIASAFRKGILTHRSVEGSVIKLYEQLEMYKDANASIDEVLTVISNLSTDSGVTISPQQYYPLYYARAYNRFGWAYALLNGSAWKRYLIYTPADTITMVDKSIDDINVALSAFGIESSNVVSGLFSEGAIDNILRKTLVHNSPEYYTFALSFNESRIGTLRIIIKKQLLDKLKRAVDFSRERRTAGILEKGRKIFSYEEFMKPETREIITTMAQFLEIMK